MDSNPQQIRFTAIVMAGGQSRRMGGGDKTRKLWKGRPLIQHVIDVVSPFVVEVIVACGQQNRSTDLDGVRFVTDKKSGIGPIAGIHAGLTAGNTDWFLVVAGDMPRLSKPLIEQIVSGVEPGVRTIVPRHDGIREPLCAAYHRDVLALIDHNLAKGLTSPLDLFVPSSTHFINVDSEQADSFFNVNYPSDLE
jgi:molybdopterin-guanine dinucleotide biosynthesis protein A